MTPLPAHEIRRRGNRRRFRRRAAITGGVATLAAAAITAVAVSTSLVERTTAPTWAGTPSQQVTSTTSSAPPSSSDAPTSSPSPSGSSTPSASSTPSPSPAAALLPQPTWANVPGVALVLGEQSRGKQALQYEGKGQAAKGLCDPGEFGSPTTHLVREFAYTGSTGDYAFAQVLGYGSVDEASAAYEKHVDAARGCAKRYDSSTEFTAAQVVVGQEMPVEAPGADVAPARQYYSTLAAKRVDNGDGQWNDTWVVQVGNRVMVLVSMVSGQDYNCGVDPTSEAGQCVFPAHAQDYLTLLGA